MDYTFIKNQTIKTIFSKNYLSSILSLFMLMTSLYYFKNLINLTDPWLRLIIISSCVYWIFELIIWGAKTIYLIKGVKKTINFYFKSDVK